MKKGLFHISLLAVSSFALLSSSFPSLLIGGVKAEAALSSFSSVSPVCRVLFPSISGAKDLDGYYSYSDGVAGGYYGELLNYLGDLSSVKMEYVIPKDESEWASMFVSFMDGSNTSDIDLMVNLNEPSIISSYPNYNDVLTFSSRTDLRNPLYIVTQDSNSSISEFDLLTYEGAKVGLVKGASSRNSPFYDWAKSVSLYEEGGSANKIAVTVFDTAALRDEAFYYGDIDIIIGGVSEEEYLIPTRTYPFKRHRH